MREGQPGSVIVVLKPEYERHPADDELGKRLAIAYLMTGAYADAMPILDSYLTRHATDPAVLFAAVLSQYQISTANGSELSAPDKAKVAKYAKAYKGPQEALLAKYLSSMGVNR